MRIVGAKARLAWAFLSPIVDRWKVNALWIGKFQGDEPSKKRPSKKTSEIKAGGKFDDVKAEADDTMVEKKRETKFSSPFRSPSLKGPPEESQIACFLHVLSVCEKIINFLAKNFEESTINALIVRVSVVEHSPWCQVQEYYYYEIKDIWNNCILSRTINSG